MSGEESSSGPHLASSAGSWVCGLWKAGTRPNPHSGWAPGLESSPRGLGIEGDHLLPADTPHAPGVAHTAQRGPGPYHTSDQPMVTGTGLGEPRAARGQNLNLCSSHFTDGETEAQLGVKGRTSVSQPVD